MAVAGFRSFVPLPQPANLFGFHLTDQSSDIIQNLSSFEDKPPDREHRGPESLAAPAGPACAAERNCRTSGCEAAGSVPGLLLPPDARSPRSSLGRWRHTIGPTSPRLPGGSVSRPAP